MASSSATSPLLPLLSLLLIATALSYASARPGLPFHPCNTLIISTYSLSILPQNPNSNLLPHRPQYIVDSTDLHPFRHRRFLPLMINARPESIPHLHHHQQNQQPDEFLGFSSLKDRTKDILSVVASLIFGAACGALSAATMYLIWSLFNPRHGSYRSLDGFSSDDDDNDDDDDIFNPKKTGYVAIPAAPAPAPAPAKGVDSAPVVAVAAPVPASAKESA